MKRTPSKKSKKVRQLEVKKIMTDEEIKKREGDFFREKIFRRLLMKIAMFFIEMVRKSHFSTF